MKQQEINLHANLAVNPQHLFLDGLHPFLKNTYKNDEKYIVNMIKTQTIFQSV